MKYSTPEILEDRIAPATFIVNTTVDSIDAPNSGTMSLRDAIALANAHAGADTIKFKAGVAGMMTLLHGELRITDTLAIKGPGVAKLIISANNSSRIFDCADGDATKDHPVGISGMGLINGNGTGAINTGDGGAIFSTESLALSNLVITASTTATGMHNGGGVEVNGIQTPGTKVLVTNCVIGNNHAGASGGGLDAQVSLSAQVVNSRVVSNAAGTGFGGGISMDTDDGKILSLKGCTITGNTAKSGAGANLEADGAPITVTNTLASQNTATDRGGGFFIETLGKGTLKGITVSGNTADGGGGLYLHSLQAVTLSNSKVTGNKATGHRGGGVYFVANNGQTSMVASVTGSQITGNYAGTNGGGIAAIDGVNLTLSSATVDANHSGGGGGGLYAGGLGAARINVKITGGELSQNDAGGVGGGMYTSGDGSLTISGLKVSGNLAQAPDGGGGLRLNTNTFAKLTNVTVTGNESLNESGGGLSVNLGATTATLMIKGGSIAGNFAGSTGGGLFVEGSGTGSIAAAKITGNIAAVSGGGLYSELGSSIKLIGATIAGNVAVQDPDVN